MRTISTIAIVFFLSVAGWSIVTREDLMLRINELSNAIEEEVKQDREVVEVIEALVAKPQSITVGSAYTKGGLSTSLPVIFKAGTVPLSTLQFDLKIPGDVNFISFLPGESAENADKGVQSSLVDGDKRRFIIFGLNQNAIGTGVLARIELSVDSTGKKPIVISGIVGADPSGANVPLTGFSGSITGQ